MLECLIVGDSIAVGTAQYRPECVSLSKGGINSWQWNKQNAGNSLTAKTVIISLGSNDHSGVRTIWELQNLREKVNADRVYWILPAIKPHIQKMVTQIANDHNDVIIPITKLQKDGVHPTGAGYKEIAAKTK